MIILIINIKNELDLTRNIASITYLGEFCDSSILKRGQNISERMTENVDKMTNSIAEHGFF